MQESAALTKYRARVWVSKGIPISDKATANVSQILISPFQNIEHPNSAYGVTFLFKTQALCYTIRVAQSEAVFLFAKHRNTRSIFFLPLCTVALQQSGFTASFIGFVDISGKLFHSAFQNFESYFSKRGSQFNASTWLRRPCVAKQRDELRYTRTLAWCRTGVLNVL